ncbi:tyrosine-type recombinase/integrase [Crateriforma conspicua]|uniref:tyrosine-type recombinase/integrase n=1 Tax=Crateriforma conspicua TaxID=2527996 RepID=UPI00118B7DB6|nr:site-specific integrase [Crateriforma conspicua]QDV63053.1 Phage integrase family protein [Crateriforma conspicua]
MSQSTKANRRPRRVENKKYPGLTYVYRSSQKPFWRKRYRGNEYHFRILDGETVQDSYRRCLDEWKQKKIAIDAEAQPYAKDQKKWEELLSDLQEDELALAKRDDANVRWDNGVRESGGTHDDGDLAKAARVRDKLEYVQMQIEIVKDFIDQRLRYDEKQVSFLFEPKNVYVKHSKLKERCPREKSIAGYIDRFLAAKREDVEKGKIQPTRYDPIRRSLDLLAELVDCDQAVATIDGEFLYRYYDALKARVEDKSIKFNETTARLRLQGVKQFVGWLATRDVIVRPSVLGTRELSFSAGTPEVVIFPDEELAILFGEADDRMRLYMLLMLNCGFQQTDIANLKQSEIDWENGYVTRQRSKTSKHHAGSVPMVVYQLWPETFKLLKQFRSKDKEWALVNRKGGQLVVSEIGKDGKVKKIDNIKSHWNRLVNKLRTRSESPVKIRGALKAFRKTSATKLYHHSEHREWRDHFLGHSASRSMADDKYVDHSKPVPDFDKAVNWLGSQLTSSGVIR